MANKHMKRCSMLLIIREMQIKTTVRYHFKPIRMAIIKKSTNNKSKNLQTINPGQDVEEREPSYTVYCWWEFKLVQPPWRTVWRFLKNIKLELPYNPTIHFMAYTERKPSFKKICTSIIHSSTFYKGQNMEAT